MRVLLILQILVLCSAASLSESKVLAEHDRRIQEETSDDSWFDGLANNVRNAWYTTRAFLDCGDDDDSDTDDGGDGNPTPVYKGCWKDAGDRAMEHSGGDRYSTESCISYCEDLAYPYAGLQYYENCHCGNSYNKHGQVAESQCNAPCRYGDDALMCGGSWRMSVWTTGAPPGGSPSPPNPTNPPQTAPSPTNSPPTAPPPTNPPPTAPPPTNPPPTAPPPTNPVSNFNIQLDLQGVANAYEFQNAVNTWKQVITGDLTDVRGDLGAEGSACGAWPTYVDDVYICGKYEAIDGPSGVLGSAGPRHYRPEDGLPITGVMKFDSADVNRAGVNLLGVILHEMGHVLGIGTLWEINDLSTGYDLPCSYKENSYASSEFRSLTGCSGAVPLEQSFANSGSNCGHWAEACLGTEIMTPQASATLPISRITIGGLRDLGYQVNYGKAQPFSASCGGCGGSRLRRRLGDTTTTGTTTTSFALDGNTTTLSQRRKLSEEGRQAAVNYGKQVLTENRDSISLSPGSSDYPDIGGELIFVLYEEDDTIHSVLVRAAED